MVHTTDTAMLGTSGFERRKCEAYFTPSWVTEWLLHEETFDGGKVWEPACGDGAMSEVLIAAGCDVVSSDLRDYGYGVPGVDFLTAPIPPEVRHILTNPPYQLAQEFIERGLELIAETGGKAAFFLRNEYDCAAKRVFLFEHPSFAQKLVLTRRPRWVAGSTGSPRHNYAWFVWDAAHEGPATVRYLKAPVPPGSSLKQ